MAQYASSSVERTNAEVSPLLATRRSADGNNETTSIDQTDDATFDDTESRVQLERSLLRKLDTRMSILILIYILNYIDRNNVSAARLYGFEDSLGLDKDGSQFATILGIFFVPYAILQIPSNLALNFSRKPSIYIPSAMAAWGLLSLLTGTVTTYFGALCTRFLLGVVETAFFPGALFLIAKWYKRSELSQRTAYLSSGSLIASATGSLFASGILELLKDALGIETWRWLFVVEGGLTIFVAICAMFILPDFPETPAGWLTSPERALAIRRIREEVPVVAGSEHAETSTLEGLHLAIRDPKVWWLAVTLSTFTLSLSFNAYFPSIMATIGYNPTITLLLCTGPFAFATAVAIALSRHSDKTGERCWHITFSMCGGLVGFALARSTMNVAVRYISLFLICQSYAGYICYLAWASGSVSQSPAKRAVALALMNTFSSIGNFFGSYAWPKTWAPEYSSSLAICAFANVLSLTSCWILRRHLSDLNEAAAKNEARTGEARGYRYLL